MPEFDIRYDAEFPWIMLQIRKKRMDWRLRKELLFDMHELMTNRVISDDQKYQLIQNVYAEHFPQWLDAFNQRWADDARIRKDDGFHAGAWLTKKNYPSQAELHRKETGYDYRGITKRPGVADGSQPEHHCEGADAVIEHDPDAVRDVRRAFRDHESYRAYWTYKNMWSHADDLTDKQVQNAERLY